MDTTKDRINNLIERYESTKRLCETRIKTLESDIVGAKYGDRKYVVYEKEILEYERDLQMCKKIIDDLAELLDKEQQ